MFRLEPDLELYDCAAELWPGEPLVPATKAPARGRGCRLATRATIALGLRLGALVSAAWTEQARQQHPPRSSRRRLPEKGFLGERRPS
jgi:hypothetical protein